MLLLSSAVFFKLIFFKKKKFSKIIRVSNSLDLDQDLHSVRKGYQQNTKVAAQVDSKHFLECFDLTHITILLPRTILSLIVLAQVVNLGTTTKLF